jgi:hypothetical protein
MFVITSPIWHRMNLNRATKKNVRYLNDCLGSKPAGPERSSSHGHLINLASHVRRHAAMLTQRRHVLRHAGTDQTVKNRRCQPLDIDDVVSPTVIQRQYLNRFSIRGNQSPVTHTRVPGARKM